MRTALAAGRVRAVGYIAVGAVGLDETPAPVEVNKAVVG